MVNDFQRTKLMNERLMTLLDLIENESDDYDINKMTRMRFDIAEECGFTVEFGGKTTGTVQ